MLLQAVDQALDAVALTIGGPVEAQVAAMVAFAWDDRRNVVAAQQRYASGVV